MRPVKRAQVELRRLTMQSSVALLAELLRRLVAQGAVRPDLVVLTSEPRPLLLGVRRRLEQFPLQKLVPEPAMKRLDVAVLPRTPGRHRHRLGPLLRKPAGQRLADELRTVVASYSGRRPTPADHPSQHPAHVRPSQRSAYMQRQAFPSVFVHQRQPLECSSRNRAVGDKVGVAKFSGGDQAARLQYDSHWQLWRTHTKLAIASTLRRRQRAPRAFRRRPKVFACPST